MLITKRFVFFLSFSFFFFLFLSFFHFSISISINKRIKKETDWCPLHIAAYNGNVECVEALLNAGADITIKNVHSFFPPFSSFSFPLFLLSFLPFLSLVFIFILLFCSF